MLEITITMNEAGEIGLRAQQPEGMKYPKAVLIGVLEVVKDSILHPPQQGRIIPVAAVPAGMPGLPRNGG